MVHWFSHNERSFKMSIWNTSHTVGSGLMGNLAAMGTILMGGFFLVDIGGGHNGGTELERQCLSSRLRLLCCLPDSAGGH